MPSAVTARPAASGLTALPNPGKFEKRPLPAVPCPSGTGEPLSAQPVDPSVNTWTSSSTPPETKKLRLSAAKASPTNVFGTARACLWTGAPDVMS